jgi:chitinase
MDIKMCIDASKNWTAVDIKTDRLTHLIITSARIGGDFCISGTDTRVFSGEKNDVALPCGVCVCTLPEDKWDEINKIKEANPQIKIILSVGGPNAEGFSDMASTAVTRRIFAQSAAEFLKLHNLDGIDINWQYPSVPLRGHIKTRPQDRENFTGLLRELREALGKEPELSFCAPSSAWFTEAVDLYESARYINTIHLLTYSMAGDNETRHHTNLFTSNADPHEYKSESADKTVSRYIELGIPPEMLCIGYAAYGMEFRGVSDTGSFEFPGLYRKFAAKDPHVWPNGIISYDTLERYYIDKNSFIRYHDDFSKAPFLYSESEKAFISYDDPISVKEKAAYVTKNKLSGLVCHEYMYDTNLALLSALDARINLNKLE